MKFLGIWLNDISNAYSILFLIVFSARMKRLEFMSRIKIMNEYYIDECQKMENEEKNRKQQYFRGKAMFGANCRFASSRIDESDEDDEGPYPHPRYGAGKCPACYGY